jgi:hypothetical protein
MQTEATQVAVYEELNGIQIQNQLDELDMPLQQSTKPNTVDIFSQDPT